MLENRLTAGTARELVNGYLVVFFSRGMSLARWERAGLLQRELALYRELSSHFGRIAFVTYGESGDHALAREFPGIEVLPNRWKLPPNLYSVMAPWLHRKTLRRAVVFKTNQINGAWCGVVAKTLFRKPLVVRCGFLWSDFMIRLTTSWWRRVLARRLERVIFRAADAIIVAGDADRATVITRYGIDDDRTYVIPNYVDTSRFRPMPEIPHEPGRVIFIGRLEDQKNPLSLLDALRGLAGVRLSMIGDGTLRLLLEQRAKEYGLDVQFFGAVPHESLPRLLNRSEAFILPSHYEGNPKALFEAMACGVPVIAARVPGIREVLTHQETAFLCGTSPPEIRVALRKVLADPDLRDRLAVRGLELVQKDRSLARVVQEELAVLDGLA
jgi:glycosyltransferase involved in cell wall biosynthesis|tara:strand:- start:21486 stop:22637 length:1152 start_codon:yes stop_codon:yes gene_type:complete